MNTLILAQKKLLSLSYPGIYPIRNILIGVLDNYRSRAQKINIAAAGILAAALGIYVTALYFTFNLGFELRERAEEISSLEESLILLETETERRKTEFAKDHEDIVQSMEKVTSLKFLKPHQISKASEHLSP